MHSSSAELSTVDDDKRIVIVLVCLFAAGLLTWMTLTLRFATALLMHLVMPREQVIVLLSVFAASSSSNASDMSIGNANSS